MGWPPASWGQPLAIGSSMILLAGMLLFPLAFPTSSSIAVAAVDVVVLAAVPWCHWAPAEVGA